MRRSPWKAWTRSAALGACLEGAERLAEYGTERYPPDVRRRLKLLNVVSYLIAFFTLIYAVQQLVADIPGLTPVILINLALVAVALAVPFCHRWNDIAGGLLIIGAEYAAQIAFVAYLGRSSGLHIQFLVAPAALFLVLGLKRLSLILVLVGLALVLHLACWFLFPPERAILKPAPEALTPFYISAAVTTFTLIAAAVYYAFSLAEQAQAETNRLLRNILPDTVVDRLTSSPGETIADSVDDATVLFADLQGFVALAKSLGPAKTVGMLNELMHTFDDLAARHGVEKIKTIGDAYMVAAGVPKADPAHAERMAGMALDMVQAVGVFARRQGLSLGVRIGMASGPLMAGVIGAKRLTYDVWGDTVNLAARLESSGMAGRIQVSERVKAQLAGQFAFERRGTVDIKGIGAEETWFLLGPRAAGRLPETVKVAS